MGFTPKFLIDNVSVKMPYRAFAILRKSWEMIVNPDVDGYQTTLIMIACCFNQRFQNFFERDWNLNWWTSCDPSLKQRMLIWQKCWLYGWFLAVGCLVCFQCQQFTLFSSTYATLQTDKRTSLKNYNSGLGFDRLGATYFLILHLCLGRDPYYGNHWLQRLNLLKRFKPVLICRCVSLHRILQGVKCAAQTITAVPAAGMASKRSYHVQPRCWNEHRGFNFSGEFQTALLNWLCKARKELAVSLPNFLCILISS